MITRPQKRNIERKRKKIKKRGPMVSDFKIYFTVDGDIPFVTMNQLKVLLPVDIYNLIDSVVGNEITRINEDGKDGIYAGDLNIIFINIKKAVKRNLSTK